MNRDEFFAKLAGLDEDRTKKVLWNLYWRGPAQLRERIESGLDPPRTQYVSAWLPSLPTRAPCCEKSHAVLLA